MRSGFLAEPPLEFGGGKQHVEVRAGLHSWGPLDKNEPLAPRDVRLGIVGTPQEIDGFSRWIERIRHGVHGKATHLMELFPPFPGFGDASSLAADLIIDARSTRQVSFRDLRRLLSTDQGDLSEVVAAVAEILLAELRYLRENAKVDVLVCALPADVLRLCAPRSFAEREGRARPGGVVRFDLHDLLKARAMSLRCPTQLILPTTYGQKIPPAILAAAGRQPRQIQDEATCAWNFYVANYYKAGGVPWRMIRDPTALTTCHVGISFFHSVDGLRVRTSLAQVFDERGVGIIVRGGNAVESRTDRTPHLLQEDAYSLLSSALRIYRMEHRTSPARVVVHKTSKYFPEEVAGLNQAVDELAIQDIDLLHLRESNVRLFREGQYPPLRGTYLIPSDANSVMFLATQGSIPYYRTYPGMYVPRWLEIHVHQSDRPITSLAAEILALTKMNWNSTQFATFDPITLSGSKKVGELLRYLREDDTVEPRYAFYM